MTTQASPERRALLCRERGWTLSLSRQGISFRSFSYVARLPASVAGSASPAVPLHRRWHWLFPLVAGCGALTAGVLAAPAMSSGDGYSVNVAVPDRAIPAATTAAGRRNSFRHRHRSHAIADPIGYSAGDTAAWADETHTFLADDMTEQHFADLAMRTGEMQSWQARDVRYFLVAGDARRSDDAVCRNFSLLARPDAGEESVRQFERCGPGAAANTSGEHAAPDHR